MTNITRAACVSAVVLAAACVRPSGPLVQPEPMPAPVPPSAPPVAQTAPAPQTAESSRSRRPASDSSRLLDEEVARRSAEVFGDTATAPSDEAAEGPTWDIDVESYANTSSVERYVRLFTGPARERIQARLSRGTQYEAMIRGKLREGGLPEDMYYLALIESGFDPNAYSRAAAVGMWQFMTSTGRDMGLRIDWWVDERRDPFKSTTAAVRFIKGLNDQFGSLYLAAAAYNGGPGRVSRGLSRYAEDLEGTSGDDLFFALADRDYFRNETREYVPQLIAAALIAKDPQRYGMAIESLPPVTYDSVRVGPATPIPAIARVTNQTVAQVLELNPHVLRGITPPADSYFVRVPTGMADSFSVAFAALPESDRVGVRTVTSKKGESLGSIARREGLTSRQLSIYNPKLKTLKNGTLSPGQRVLVPTPEVVAAAVSVPDPGIERYSSSPSSRMHVVRSGETLSGIAKRYHTTTAALMRANGLKRALIFPGQTLVVAGRVSSTSSSSARKSTPASSSKPAVSKSTTSSKSATPAKSATSKSTTASKPATSKTAASKSATPSKPATSKSTTPSRSAPSKAASTKGTASSTKAPAATAAKTESKASSTAKSTSGTSKSSSKSSSSK